MKNVTEIEVEQLVLQELERIKFTDDEVEAHGGELFLAGLEEGEEEVLLGTALLIIPGDAIHEVEGVDLVKGEADEFADTGECDDSFIGEDEEGFEGALLGHFNHTNVIS
jgi:hypothetical protein